MAAPKRSDIMRASILAREARPVGDAGVTML